MLTLVGRSYRRSATAIATLAAVLALLQWLIVAMAANFENTRSFERLVAFIPVFLSRSFSGSLLALASFRTMAIAGFLHPAVVLATVELAIYLATEPAGDVEMGLVDMILARPIPRRRLVTRTVLVTAGGTAIVVGAMALASAAGLAVFAPPLAERPHAGTLAMLAFELLLVSWCFGAIALAAAAFGRRRGATALGVGMAAVALYLLEFLGSVWPRAEPAARVSPFDYYEGLAVLTGRADLVRDVAVLGSVTIAAVLLAYWQFARRDL